MPSLPELEVYKAQLSQALIGQSVARVEPLDFRVVRAETGALEQLLTPQPLLAILRYGKWLIFDVGAPQQLVLHLGLTGKLQILNPQADLPRFSVFVLKFKNDQRLVMTDQRKIGKVYIRNFNDVKAEKELGPDLLSIDKNYFVETLRRKRRGAHDVLMDQQIIAGIGGKYADEVLWQEKIHPNDKLDRLSEDRVGDLYRTVMAVTRRAIDLDGDVSRFPPEWLIPHRHTDKICPRCQSPLTVRGSIVHCPVCQPAPNPYRRG